MNYLCRKVCLFFCPNQLTHKLHESYGATTSNNDTTCNQAPGGVSMPHTLTYNADRGATGQGLAFGG